MSATMAPRYAIAPPVRVAVLGCGTVGSAFCRILADHGDRVTEATGIRFALAGVAVGNPARKDRGWTIPLELAWSDAMALATEPEIDVVVELIGGTGVACDLIDVALQAGKAVVTAKKDLLAARGDALRAIAEAYGARLYFEAAVGGAMPLVRTLRSRWLVSLSRALPES